MRVPPDSSGNLIQGHAGDRAPMAATGPRNPADAFAPLPREHGAWGLLLQPFVVAATLARFLDWLLLPAVALVILGFIVKDPLVVLARQRWVWRTRNPQAAVALRWLIYELAGIGIAIALLLPHAAAVPFAALAAAATLLTVIAVWFTVRNKQRSVRLQILSAAGLSMSALLVALLAAGEIPLWAWQLWGVLTLHAAGSILVVHARLRLKVVQKGKPPRGSDDAKPRLAAIVAQLVQLAVASVLVSQGLVLLAAPLLFSALCAAVELYRLSDPATLEEPLKRVGYRALTVSMAHSLLLIGVLWSAAARPVSPYTNLSHPAPRANTCDFLTRISSDCDAGHIRRVLPAGNLPLTVPHDVKESL